MVRSMVTRKLSAVGVAAFLTLGVVAPLMQPLGAGAAFPECHDGYDNDGDGRIDYPQDAQCVSLDDDFEGGSGSTATFVNVTDGRDEISAGDSLTYIITLRQDRDDARSVNVDFTLPPQATVAYASDGGSVSTQSVRWNSVTVYRNSVRTLTVHVIVNPYAAGNNLIVARVVSDASQATDTTLVRSNTYPYPNVRAQLTITDNQTQAVPGQALDYVVTLRNPTAVEYRDDVRVALGANLSVTDVFDGGERVSPTEVLYRTVSVGANSTRTLRFRGVIEPRSRRFTFVDATARSGAFTSVDRTTVRSDIYPNANFTISLTDGRTTANRGDVITYTIRVDNRTGTADPHTFVTAALPMHTEFVSATEGGVYDGNNVRWQNFLTSANGSRTLTYAVRVRQDAPREAQLIASAQVKGGATAEDRTGLDGGSFVYNNSSPIAYRGVLAVNSPASSRLVFRKTADRAEVLPGDRVRYNVFLQNRYDHALTGMTVSDRYDTGLMSVVSATDNASFNAGTVEWFIPSLAPGQTWEASYILSVRPDAPLGRTITNVATVTARELAPRTASENVYTMRTPIVNAFPTTGLSELVAALEDTSRFLTPIAAASTPAFAWLAAAMTGLGTGLKAGSKFIA